VVIGADGFGYRFDKSTGSLRKIPHIGTVRIGERVEIGANACVDRGKYAATIIGEGTKLDNLVQIGHNCRVGKHVVIAGGTMLAGSVTVGDYTQIGGMVSIADHLNVGSQCKIAGRAALMHDMPDGETWAGVPGKPLKRAAREELAIQKLPDLLRQARKWTKQMD
jgi:UDP-3-O-[3-hydroxymyristoyl] glucosamine N-acyltransferase